MSVPDKVDIVKCYKNTYRSNLRRRLQKLAPRRDIPA
ncbi:hypothetical protein M7I_4865 [Glarea lozoyensis 74030]|uniref:Uncharacterized protein n=1 Tax=Glarea lozoyensis (strain ATCC 74030 / MF5533) TaxID=1104152 RepID=H0EQB7_GLAL7|nr:hypothetical protein M7I_4865 [Glarea lozoyensis 74030]